MQGPSNENLHLGPSEEKHSIHDKDKNKNRIPNTLRSPDGGYKYGQSPKRTSTGANLKPCRPSVPTYDADRYTEFLLRLECLKNLQVEEVPGPGEFILRAMCMGQVYGHFPSGNVDQETLEPSYRNEDHVSNSPKCVDVYLDHDISFCIKFTDLIDNPLVLHLCRVSEDTDPDSYENVPPLGFICLDLGRLAGYKATRLAEHLEPWHMTEKSQPRGRRSSRPGMVPSLQLTIECFGGFPDSKQLLQGNLMTVLCESFHNLPAAINQSVAYPENSPDVTMFMSLPHSKADPVLKFPGARYKETFLLEPSFKKMSLDENTQTMSNQDLTSDQPQQKQAQGRKSMDHFSIQLNQPPREGRHWASVKDHFPDTPAEATIMTPDSTLDPVESTADAEHEIFGDGREDFMEFSETGDPRLVWNSVHRKYIHVDSYRGMLARLSQNSIWPIEVYIAVKKKSGDRQKKKKETSSNASKGVQQNAGENSGATQQPPNASTSNESTDKMIMGELGQQSSSTTSEYSLIYHGIAFVDLSCLVNPGTKSARFSCRLVPFSTDLLQKKTCAVESMVPESLLSTLSPKASGDNNRVANSTTKRQTQGGGAGGGDTKNNTNSGGNPATSSKPVRPSQGYDPNQNDNQTPQQTGTLQHHGSVTRRSDVGNDNSKKLHVHGSPDDNTGGEHVDGRNVIDRNPFIVFRISMLRSIVPCYKTNEISNVVEDFLPKRHLTRRKPVSSSSAQQKYKKAILEAAAELSHEFSEHYWKEILQNGQTGSDQSSSNSASTETIKKGFLFYLNASGRYLILREHLRSAISTIVQQKCIVLRPQGFHNHRDFQSYLHDIYVFLVDEMNEILTATTAQETDPLKNSLDRLLQQTGCSQDEDLSKVNLHNRQILDLGVYAEESLAQGDFETCHKLHLQRICRDKESSRCWMEFAIMWLARGDDRMAEIAVREALRKDPLHFYALLISGMIAVRHGDERGLECLGAALGLYPMAPEILVVVGIANSMAGNDFAADFFFRKAAYIHRVITGQSTEDIDKIFTANNSTKPFNLKQYTQDLDAGVSHVKEPKAKEVVLQVDESQFESQSQAPVRKKKKSKSRFSKVDRNSIKISTNINPASTIANASAAAATVGGGGADEDTQVPKRLSKEKRRSLELNNNGSKTIISDSSHLKSTETMSPESTQQQQQSNGPTYNFVENMSDILPEEMELPKLTTSIQSPYKITEFSETMEKHLLTIDYLEKIAGTRSAKQAKGQTRTNGPSNVYIPKDEGVAPDNQIKQEYDKIINGEGQPSSGSGSGSQSGTFRASLDTISKSTNSNVKGKRNSSKSASGTKRASKEDKVAQKEQEQNTSSNVNTTFSKPSEIPVNASQSVADSKVNVDPEDFKQMTESLPQLPKLTDRLGTELIWAADLLINLRLFDCVDGALAKHLYFYGKRTVQFIYLRALSLYLRQREEEALPLVKEAIEFDSSNGMYFALEGHCHYVLGNSQEAITSYEKALRMPHTNENRHLLYLRYGSLVLDQGKSKIAKRVFLHGVTKYPTPYMWLALGSACFQRQEYDQAETAFAEANRLDSTNPIAWGHLALSSLMQDKKSLAEQAYKWALRFGLKKGVLMNEIQRLQQEKGFGDPSFPRIPNCVPHDYYLRRMGRIKPFNLYKEALNQDPPRMGRDRYQDTENELMLKKKLATMGEGDGEEWLGEGEFEEGEEEGVVSVASEGISNRPTQSTGFKVQTQSQRDGLQVQSAPPDMVTVMAPKSAKSKPQQ